MSIKANSSGARETVGGYMDSYSPPVSETPSGDSKVYSRDLNVSGYSVSDDESYVYNFGTPTSPHERWGNVAHRSAAFSAGGGVRSSVDLVSSRSKSSVGHEVDDLPTVKHLPGYH